MQDLQLHHLCIQTNRYRASLEFYREALGMELLLETPDFHGRDYNTWLRGGGVMLELQTPRRGGAFSPVDDEGAGIAHLCFYVRDIDAAYRELAQRGFADFLPHGEEAVYTVNGGRLFKLRAPEGTVIEFRDNPGC